MKRFHQISTLLLAGGCFFVACESPQPEVAKPTENGRVLLFIGQDRIAPRDYAASGHFPAPGGVVGYTSIYDVEGLSSSVWRGETVEMNLLQTFADHPQAVGMIGLYMVEQEEHSDGLTGITEGRYDDQIETLAKVLNEGARPVLVRIGYEFDGIWNHYEPQKYIAAYRYIVDQLRAQTPYFVSVWHGATSPADVYLDRYNLKVEDEDFRDWYPGDDYVDWIGVSWFLSHLPMQRSLAQTFADFSKERHKPLIIAESSPQGYDFVNKDWRNVGLVHENAAFGLNAPAASLIREVSDDEIWTQWFEPLLAFIHENDDVVRALCYINHHWNADPMWQSDAEGNYTNGYWGDARLEANPALSDLWKAEINDPAWVHGGDVHFEDWMPENAAALVD